MAMYVRLGFLKMPSLWAKLDEQRVRTVSRLRDLPGEFGFPLGRGAARRKMRSDK